MSEALRKALLEIRQIAEWTEGIEPGECAILRDIADTCTANLGYEDEKEKI